MRAPLRSSALPTHRLVLRVRGVVQGVGFRPAMCRLARSHGLAGSIRNDGDAVHIEIEGAAHLLRRFVRELPGHVPVNARIDAIDSSPAPPRRERGFRIITSEAGTTRGLSIPPDLAPCAACLHELFDPMDRRYRYPFINCTDCGPRFTIVSALPYDRDRTTMATFPLCDACRGEYEDPDDRRFHAEPTACPRCGPRVTLLENGRDCTLGHAAIERAGQLLASGAIVAVKGVGGYALAVDATNAAAVASLRQRKRRPHKPLAIMARSVASADRIAVLDGDVLHALESPARPIVIAPLLAGGPLAPEVAPGLADVGVMLPPSPLHQLLAGAAPEFLVMTSGNRSTEPIAIEDRDAQDRLAGVADAFLTHDRAICARADDSVVRALGRGVVTIRRARGYAPRAVDLPLDGPMVLAVGGQQSNSVCLASGRQALPSQHIGDLGCLETYAFFERVIEDLLSVAGGTPVAVAHDMHPDYRSTRWALESGLPAVGVQHHHAHLASCLVENGITGPVIGVAFDGTGFGLDGTLWGGEFFEVELSRFRRLGHLRQLSLAGGESAIREPWRLALAAMLDAGEPVDRVRGADPGRARAVRALLEGSSATVRASGAGRWFDAVAALCGLCTETSYDGQPAAELEAAAASAPDRVDPYDLEVEHQPGHPFRIDLRPAIRAIAAELRGGTSTVAEIAARFHETMALAVVAGCRLARGSGSPAMVALSGGCFQNRRLVGRARVLLKRCGFQVFTHRRLPPNDGGLSVGQAAVARQILSLKGDAQPDVSRNPG